MYALIALTASVLVTHPMPSGKPGVIVFEDLIGIEEYKTLNPNIGPVCAVKMTKKEAKTLQHIEW